MPFSTFPPSPPFLSLCLSAALSPSLPPSFHHRAPLSLRSSISFSRPPTVSVPPPVPSLLPSPITGDEVYRQPRDNLLALRRIRADCLPFGLSKRANGQPHPHSLLAPLAGAADIQISGNPRSLYLPFFQSLSLLDLVPVFHLPDTPLLFRFLFSRVITLLPDPSRENTLSTTSQTHLPSATYIYMYVYIFNEFISRTRLTAQKEHVTLLNTGRRFVHPSRYP